MTNQSAGDQATVFVIPHTHWDREWYATFQQFRLRLVHVMDALIDLLEREPAYTHFNLDAQTVILQDYLEIRPENKGALMKFIQDRRLGVGPWYVLPDEFLVSGESLVRNLLLGHRIAAEFGHVQKVGYIPDTFGHISQLPQILLGFDIPYAMHFRGLDEGDLKSELWWQSPDGSRVLLRHLPADMGYANASALALDTNVAATELHTYARHETRRAASSVLLLLNGVDHLPAREDLPAILKIANSQQGSKFHFQQGSLEDYFSALEIALKGKPLQTVHGELRDSNRTPGRDNRLVPAVLSSRIYNKMQNERTQTLLENWAEPWSALTWLEGEEYPGAFLWKAWEWLLQNHPHDSICGCSVDAVHAQMETRFAWAAEIGDEITRERFDLLARRIDLSGLKDDEAALVVYNNLPWPVEEGITLDIDLWHFFLNRVALDRWKQTTLDNSLQPGASASALFHRRVLEQWYGDPPNLPDPRFRGLRIRPLDESDPLPVQIDSMGQAAVLRPFVSGPASERRGVQVRATFLAKLPPFGYQVYAVAPLEKPNKPVIVAHPHNVLENEHLRVHIASNGTFNVEEKASGLIFKDLGYLEDGGDCGDGYNYSHPLEDRVENTLGIAPSISCLSPGPVIQRYRIDFTWSLPESLDDLRRRRKETRIACPVSMILTLSQGSPRLDLEVTFDNHARDHRLRMVFPSDIHADQSHASAQFDVVTHPIRVTPVPDEAWVEDAPTTFPQQDWVDLSDGQRGFCIISRGLPEYEVLNSDRREVIITLLRAVGFLGAGSELQTASIGAGPNIATPEAQIQRKITFSLSVLPHPGKWDQAEVWRQAWMRKNPPRGYTTAMDKYERASQHGTGPSRCSFLKVEGKNAILSALKKAESGDALILRLYNPSDLPTQATLQLPFTPRSVQLAGLDEKPRMDGIGVQAPLMKAGGEIALLLPPKKVVTLWVEKS